MPKPVSRNRNPILAEALRLYNLGWWVVPCAGKKANVWKDWQNAKRSRQELEAALSGPQAYNIAIVLSQSEFCVVECDTPEAEKALLELFGGQLPKTPTWYSARGPHLLFRRPAGLPKRRCIEIEGIEFHIANGVGANALVPPSIHPETGKQYHWEPGLSIHEVVPVELPTHIVERLRATSPKAKPAANGDKPTEIAEGSRNKELYKIACQLVAAGLSSEAIEQALHAENNARCTPPLPPAEVASILKSALQGDEPPAQTAAQTLAAVATDESDLWHTLDGEAFATIPCDDHREHWRINSTAFRHWLSAQYWQKTKAVISGKTLHDVINALEGRAIFDGATYDARIRLAEHNDCIYVDLCDNKWRAVEIDANGWRVVANPPVRFRRAKAMQPLSLPQAGGAINELRRFINVSNTHWPLLVSWLVAAMRPRGPYPILKLVAEQGSGKTTVARVLRALTDPNSAAVRSAPSMALPNFVRRKARQLPTGNNIERRLRR